MLEMGAGKTRSTGISLQQLVENNLLQPGKDVLMVEYKSQVIKADLTEAGTILYMVSALPNILLVCDLCNKSL